MAKLGNRVVFNANFFTTFFKIVKFHLVSVLLFLLLPTCHLSASSLSIVATDADFFTSLRHSFLSSHVLYISKFVINNKKKSYKFMG